MVTERFLYEIHPHRPIKNLIPGRSIIKPCSMKLTKEEVLTCMKSGPVFRAFPGKDLIRVTGSNLDQLHTDKFVEEKISTSEANYTPKAENVTRAQDPSPEEPKTEAPREEIPEENTNSTETEEIPEIADFSGNILTHSEEVELAEINVMDQEVEEVASVEPTDGLTEVVDPEEDFVAVDNSTLAVEEPVKEVIDEVTEEVEESTEETEEEVDEEATDTPAPQSNAPHVNIHSSKKYYNKKRH